MDYYEHNKTPERCLATHRERASIIGQTDKIDQGAAMDLRERKTRASIKQAFLALRAEKSLERITVRELVERAEVGKATFYLHYRSVYDLSDALQREAIAEIVGAIAEPEAYLAAPDRVTRQLFEAFRTHADVVDVLFSGEQAGVLAQSVEHAMRLRVAEQFPQVETDPRVSALFTFEIQGGYYAYRAARARDSEAQVGASPAEQAAVDAIAQAALAITGLIRADG